MNRKVYAHAGIAVVLGALVMWEAPREAVAGVNVGVNVNIGPPPIVVPAPPAVVPVPRTGVYFVPGVDFDVFFYNGYWWSPRGDRWYRAGAYDGPWRVIERRYVPGPVFRVPRDYRARYVGERHVPYGQWKKEHMRHEGREHREHDDFHDRGDRGEHGHGHGR